MTRVQLVGQAVDGPYRAEPKHPVACPQAGGIGGLKQSAGRHLSDVLIGDLQEVQEVVEFRGRVRADLQAMRAREVLAAAGRVVDAADFPLMPAAAHLGDIRGKGQEGLDEKPALPIVYMPGFTVVGEACLVRQAWRLDWR